MSTERLPKVSLRIYIKETRKRERFNKWWKEEARLKNYTEVLGRESTIN